MKKFLSALSIGVTILMGTATSTQASTNLTVTTAIASTKIGSVADTSVDAEIVKLYGLPFNRPPEYRRGPRQPQIHRESAHDRMKRDNEKWYRERERERIERERRERERRDKERREQERNRNEHNEHGRDPNRNGSRPLTPWLRKAISPDYITPTVVRNYPQRPNLARRLPNPKRR